MYESSRRRRPKRELDYNLFNSATKATLERREKSMRKRDSYNVDESGYEQERIQTRRSLERLNRRSTPHDQYISSTKSLLKTKQHLIRKEKSVFNNSDFVQEKARPGRQEEPTRRSRERPRHAREETGACYGRDPIKKSQKQQATLDYLDSQQCQDDLKRIAQQVLQDFVTDQQRKPTSRPSSKLDGPKSCSKKEQIIQELETEPSKVIMEYETENEFFVVSPQTELVISSTSDELTYFEPVQPSSLVSVSHVSEEHSPETEQKSQTQGEVLEQLISLEPETTHAPLTPDSLEHCKELNVINYVPELFVMVDSKNVERFGLERVKEFCVSKSVFDNMIDSFKVFEPDKLSDQKRFQCDNDNYPGHILSIDQFMEHNKSFDHPERRIELVLQQSDLCFRKPCDSFACFDNNGFYQRFSTHKLITGDLLASTCVLDEFMVRNKKPKSLRAETEIICDSGLKLGILCSEIDKSWQVLRSLLENCVVLSFDDILVYNTFFEKHVEPLIRDFEIGLKHLCSDHERARYVLELFYDISCLDTILVYNTYFDVHLESLKRVQHVLRNKCLVIDQIKNMFYLYDTGYLVFVLSVQDQQNQSQRSEKKKGKHHVYQPEIWRWKYLRKMASKLQGSFCPKTYFNVVYMFLFLNLCLESNMFPFDVGDTDLRTNLFKGGGDDATLISYATLDELRPADDTEDKLKPAEESVYEVKPAEVSVDELNELDELDEISDTILELDEHSDTNLELDELSDTEEGAGLAAGRNEPFSAQEEHDNKFSLGLFHANFDQAFDQSF